MEKGSDEIIIIPNSDEIVTIPAFRQFPAAYWFYNQNGDLVCPAVLSFRGETRDYASLRGTACFKQNSYRSSSFEYKFIKQNRKTIVDLYGVSYKVRFSKSIIMTTLSGHICILENMKKKFWKLSVSSYVEDYINYLRGFSPKRSVNVRVKFNGKRKHSEEEESESSSGEYEEEEEDMPAKKRSNYTSPDGSLLSKLGHMIKTNLSDTAKEEAIARYMLSKEFQEKVDENVEQRTLQVKEELLAEKRKLLEEASYAIKQKTSYYMIENQESIHEEAVSRLMQDPAVIERAIWLVSVNKLASKEPVPKRTKITPEKRLAVDNEDIDDFFLKL